MKEIYKKCKKSLLDSNPENHVKELYDIFSYEEISDSIAEIVKPDGFKSDLKIVYQNIENLNKACPSFRGLVFYWKLSN